MSTWPAIGAWPPHWPCDSTKNFVRYLEEGGRNSRGRRLQTLVLHCAGLLERAPEENRQHSLTETRHPAKEERYRSSTIVADRPRQPVADPAVRNALEKRQPALIDQYLTGHDYKLKAHLAATPSRSFPLQACAILPAEGCYRLITATAPPVVGSRCVWRCCFPWGRTRRSRRDRYVCLPTTSCRAAAPSGRAPATITIRRRRNLHLRTTAACRVTAIWRQPA